MFIDVYFEIFWIFWLMIFQTLAISTTLILIGLTVWRGNQKDLAAKKPRHKRIKTKVKEPITDLEEDEDDED